MLKKEARNLYRQKRMTLTAAERSKMDDLLLIQFQMAFLPMLTNVLSFWPIEENHEPNTHLFTAYLEFKFPELQILYPRSDFQQNEMQAVQVDEETRFVKNRHHIYEPENGTVIAPANIDMVFVPLLAFDKKGYRVGYGKGFYDRFLQHCRGDCVKAGFSYFEPLDRIGDCDDFDVPLDLCITPQNMYVF